LSSIWLHPAATRRIRAFPGAQTSIATSRFAKGTQDAAFAIGAAPITLIDGDKLVELMIDHGIGVRKRPVEVLELDLEAFVAAGSEAEGA